MSEGPFCTKIKVWIDASILSGINPLIDKVRMIDAIFDEGLVIRIRARFASRVNSTSVLSVSRRET